MIIARLRRWRLSSALGIVLFSLLAAARAGAEEWSAEVLRHVNEERAAVGLGPLARAPELDLAALRHVSDMARGDFLSHTGSDGSSSATRVRETGYPALTCGENVAAGYPTAESVMAGWMRSPPHRANILNARFTEIGIAVVYRPGTRYGTYWTQVFGARARLIPAGTPGNVNPTDPTAAAAEPTDRLLGLVNEQRRANRLAALSREPELDEAARRHARDMAGNGFFGYLGSDGSAAGDRIRAAGYLWTTHAENIAAGFPLPEAVLAAWMASPGQRENLLNPAFRDVGVALVADERSPWGIYWTMTFGTRATP
jgi:uncharacterized protein YkwD